MPIIFNSEPPRPVIAYGLPYERVRLNESFAQRGFIESGQSLYVYHPKGMPLPVEILRSLPVRNVATRKRLKVDRSGSALVADAIRAIGG